MSYSLLMFSNYVCMLNTTFFSDRDDTENPAHKKLEL